jgi:hypothetical protein
MFARRLTKQVIQKRSLATTAKFQFAEECFETHNCPRPSSETSTTREELLSLFKVMVEIRRLEMACDQVGLLVF